METDPEQDAIHGPHGAIAAAALAPEPEPAEIHIYQTAESFLVVGTIALCAHSNTFRKSHVEGQSQGAGQRAHHGLFEADPGVHRSEVNWNYFNAAWRIVKQQVPADLPPGTDLTCEFIWNTAIGLFRLPQYMYLDLEACLGELYGDPDFLPTFFNALLQPSGGCARSRGASHLSDAALTRMPAAWPHARAQAGISSSWGACSPWFRRGSEDIECTKAWRKCFMPSWSSS
jgi:hypothetical protein